MKWSGAVIGMIIVAFCTLAACRNDERADNEKPVAKSDFSLTKKAHRPVELPPPAYTLLRLSKQEKDSLKNRFTGPQLYRIAALNRVDVAHVRRLDSLIIPDTFYVDWLRYAPFPLQVTALDSIVKIIFYSYPAQAFAVYEKGQLVRWGPVSLGKKSTPTPTGLFFTNWRALKTTSTFNDEWVMKWYFNLDNFEGVSMHQYELPGYPASHACARLLEEDAQWMYNWCDQWILENKRNIAAYGTPVIIYGSYDFDAPRPWLQLPQNKTVLHINEQQLAKEAAEFLPLIIKRQQERATVLNRPAAPAATAPRQPGKKKQPRNKHAV